MQEVVHQIFNDAEMKKKVHDLASQCGPVRSLSQITYDAPTKRNFLISFMREKDAEIASKVLNGSRFGFDGIILTFG